MRERKRQSMQLSRTIGFFRGNIFLLSSIIGAGIFVSPKGVLQYSSLNIPISLSIWVLCAILSMINALCVAEIGTTFPKSEATYYFLKRSLGSCIAFLSLWIKLFSYFIGLAAQSLLVASYLIQPFYGQCPPPELPKKCLALAILWSLGLLNIRGLTSVSRFQTVSSLVKTGILCFISLTGIVLLVIGKKENVSRFEKALDAELPDASHIAEAILQGLYPFIGSTLLVTMAGEVKNPGETIPRSLISALSIVTVIYLLTNISFLIALTPKEIIFSDSVAVTWMDRVLPSMQWVISLGISAAVIDNTSCGILGASRVIYAASQEGQLPLMYTMLNEHLSPAVALIQLISISSIFVILSNLIHLIKYIGLVFMALTALQKIGILKLRYQEPDLQRPYKVWWPFIYISLAMSIFLICMSSIQSSQLENIYQVIFLLSGLLVYKAHVHFNQHFVCCEEMIYYVQLLFNVAPSDDHETCISADKNE